MRDSRISQIDTMHQHARMFGYRKTTLEYTRLFITRQLYYRFRDIHFSDSDLRAFIDAHQAELPASFPIGYTYDLKTTRQGVLDVNKTDTIFPGMHIYPNYIGVPQNQRTYNKILGTLQGHFGTAPGTEDELQKLGQSGVEISAQDAIALAKMIKTHSKNTWRDKTIGAIIDKVAVDFGGKISLKFRTAERSVREGGFIPTGTLAGDALSEARGASLPTLWIMAVRSKQDSLCCAGEKFMYPTFVIPQSFQKLYMFNRG